MGVSRVSQSSTLFGGSGAVISDCGLYRYSLERRWDASTEKVMFVMLNPSTADAEHDDPTLRRCIGFARSWGFGGLMVGNLYAYRATDPRALIEATRAGIDPVGPENDRWLIDMASRAGLVIAAWGAQRKLLVDRAAQVMDLLPYGLRVLGLTKDCNPRHPLYVRGDAKPRDWSVVG